LEAFENLARAGGVARLRRQRGAGNVRRHAVMRHGPPRMVFRRRLRKPHIAGIAGELAAFQRANNGVAIADLGAGGIHQIGAALHASEHLIVEKIFGLRMQRGIDGDHVADRYHLGRRLMKREAQLLLDAFRQTMPVISNATRGNVDVRLGLAHDPPRLKSFGRSRRLEAAHGCRGLPPVPSLCIQEGFRLKAGLHHNGDLAGGA
jgi:hypothetical protein